MKDFCENKATVELNVNDRAVLDRVTDTMNANAHSLTSLVITLDTLALEGIW